LADRMAETGMRPCPGHPDHLRGAIRRSRAHRWRSALPPWSGTTTLRSMMGLASSPGTVRAGQLVASAGSGWLRSPCVVEQWLSPQARVVSVAVWKAGLSGCWAGDFFCCECLDHVPVPRKRPGQFGRPITPGRVRSYPQLPPHRPAHQRHPGPGRHADCTWAG
jgi:hypothetical protein